ncbi:Mediator of RNA polymerase II transcription subunit 31 [Paecilomyces lecythidis]
MEQPPPPTLTNPRFTLELEFVLSLANPHYLSHLAVNYPKLLGTSTADNTNDENDADGTASPDAQAFAAYLAYLYSYWKTPEYAQFLTHPGATLRALRLLQEEAFRRDIIRPQVIEGLLGMGEEGAPSGQELEASGTDPEQGKQNAEQQPEIKNGIKT